MTREKRAENEKATHGKMISGSPERTAKGTHHRTYHVAHAGITQETSTRRSTAHELITDSIESALAKANTKNRKNIMYETSLTA